MQRHLFLTGPSGVGKTTLIRKVLGPRALGYAGGFVTEREVDEDGTLLGFDLYPGAAAADFSLYEGWRFLDFGGPVLMHDNELFREKAVELLEQAEYYPYAMIDEFGGFELLIPQFRGALANFLNLTLPIIGVLKDEQSVLAEQKTFGLSSRFPATADMVRHALEQDANTLLVKVTEPGDPHAEALVRRWAEEYVHIP